MIEDHWETRQDYVKTGNELARLAMNQEQEKKEQERIAKEQKEAAKTVTYQANNVSGGTNGVPVSVPMKQSHGNTPTPEAPKMPTSFDNPAANQNLGMRGFQNQPMNSSMARPMNQNPFMGGNHRF